MNPISWTGGGVPSSYTTYPNQSAMGNVPVANTWMQNPAYQYPGYMAPPSIGSSRSAVPYTPLSGSNEQNQDRSHQCRWCEKAFSHESSKCRHEKEHFNQFPCPEPGCDQVSTRKDSLKRHLRLMHGISEGSTSESSRRGGSRTL